MPPVSCYPLLVIDAGNSAVKFATVDRAGAKPRIVASVETPKLTVTRVRTIFRQIRTRSAVASCVVPSAAIILRAGCPSVSLLESRRRSTSGRMSIDERSEPTAWPTWLRRRSGLEKRACRGFRYGGDF